MNPSILAEAIGHMRWTAQLAHQAYHQDSTVEWRECRKDICASARHMVERIEARIHAELEPLQATSHATVEQLVTQTKLRGSALSLHGVTTPEGWPYRALIAVGSPGNEAVIRFVDDVDRAIASQAAFAALIEAKRS